MAAGINLPRLADLGLFPSASPPKEPFFWSRLLVECPLVSIHLHCVLTFGYVFKNAFNEKDQKKSHLVINFGLFHKIISRITGAFYQANGALNQIFKVCTKKVTFCRPEGKKLWHQINSLPLTCLAVSLH